MDTLHGKTAVANTVSAGGNGGSPPSSTAPVHGAPQVADADHGDGPYRDGEVTVEEIDESKKGWFAYFQTRDFYIVLLLG